MKNFIIGAIPRFIFFKLNFIIELFGFFFKSTNIKIFSYFCKKRFKKINSEKQILIELNSFYSSIIPLSYFSNFLSKKQNSKLISYDNDLSTSKIMTFYYFVKKIFYKPISKIYESFGVISHIRPSNSKNIENITIEFFNRIIKEIKTKEELVDLNVEGIWIGDLIYDSYLKEFKKETINLNCKKFKFFLKKSLTLFFYWKNYFDKNNITAVVATHTVYISSIILRIAISRKILVYQISMNQLYKLDKAEVFAHKEFNYFKTEFNTLDEKELRLNKAKTNIERRLSGEVGVDMPYSTKSAYNKVNKNINVLNKSNKIKILIAAHCFFDSPHPYGKNIFPDLYEWLNFLSEISQITDYEWYIKLHPDFIPKNFEIIKSFIKRNKKFKLLNNYTSHNQLIYEKINFCLTVYGTIGAEYAYKNIVVINASKNNPHNKYNFNINPKTIDEYKNLLLDLKKVDLKIDQKEVLEFYYMHNIYRQRGWFVEDYITIINGLGGRELADKKLNTSEILKYFVKNIYSTEMENKLKINMDNFFNKSEYKCNYDFLSNSKCL